MANIWNKYRAAIGATLATLAAILLPTARANAGWFTDATIDTIMQAIFGLVYSLMGFLVNMGAFVMNFAFLLSSGIVNSIMVKTGFSISLYLINLVFVLILIVIAMATILRYERFGMKKLLPTLLATAIFVNFGLVIAGIILNLSDQVSTFFVTQGAPAGSTNPFADFSDSLVAQLKATGLAKVNGSNMTATITSNFFSIIFLFLIATVLFTVGIVLIYRYVVLSMSLIVMPLQLGSAAIPFYNKAQKWWTDFMKWVMFPPALLFFLYLSLVLVSTLTSGSGSDPGISAALAEFNKLPVTKAVLKFIGVDVSNTQFITGIVQRIILIAFVLLGLQMAKGFGVAGAGVALGAATAIGKGAKKRMVSGAKRAGAAAKSMAGKAAGAAGVGAARLASIPLRRWDKAAAGIEEMQNAGANMGWVGKKFTAPARMVGRALQAKKEAANAILTNRQKDFDKMSMSERVSRLSGATSDLEKAALLKAIAADKKNGGLKNVKNLERYFEGDVYDEATGKLKEKSKVRVALERYGDTKSFDTLKRDSGITAQELATRLGDTSLTPDQRDKMQSELATVLSKMDSELVASSLKDFKQDDFADLKGLAESDPKVVAQKQAYEQKRKEMARVLMTNAKMSGKAISSIIQQVYESETENALFEVTKDMKLDMKDLSAGMKSYINNTSKNSGLSFEQLGIAGEEQKKKGKIGFQP